MGGPKLCADKVYFGLAHWLIWGGAANIKWTEYVEKKVQPDIVIINAGAHFEDMGDFHNVWGQVMKDVHFLRGKFPHISIAWKTRNPGHV